MYRFGVMIRCFTYNQSDYIVQALSSFVCQRTSFPFIIVLVDDASTDGQPIVIDDFINREFITHSDSFAEEKVTDFAKIRCAHHKFNENCFIVAYYLNQNHYSTHKPKEPYIIDWVVSSKYQAFCEGDDFWVDKDKLQIQYDYLESHENCSLCFTAHQTLYTDGRIDSFHRYKGDVDSCPIRDCITQGGSYARLNSIMYRYSCSLPLPRWYKYTSVGDLPLLLTLFSRGDVAYLDRVTSCYRKNAKGSWTERIKKRSIKQILYDAWKRLLFWNSVNRETGWKYFPYVLFRQIHDLLSSLRAIINRMVHHGLS